MILLLLLWGCAGTLDSAVKSRSVPRLAAIRDLDVACAFGEVGVAASLTISRERSGQALTVAWTMAGLCSELQAREAAIQARLAMARGDTAGASDGRIAAARLHAKAAERYQQAYQLALDEYGDADRCRFLSRADEGVYLLGLMAGQLAQVNDGESGGVVSVPLNQIIEVGRASLCLDDEAWWAIPEATRMAGWATVPGSGPADLDPWQGLAAAAARGDALGQGIPRSLWLFAAANAGRADQVREILAAWPEPVEGQPQEWALLDQYARQLARHEADLLWIAEEGHRAPAPPAPPLVAAAPPPDPFGD